jgi:hypothetical protein
MAERQSKDGRRMVKNQVFQISVIFLTLLTTRDLFCHIFPYQGIK